jgi:hypothetical protein
MTTTKAENSQTPAPKGEKERYLELLSSVQAKALMMATTPGSSAEFPEFAELNAFADKLS